MKTPFTIEDLEKKAYIDGSISGFKNGRLQGIEEERLKNAGLYRQFSEKRIQL